MSAKSKLPSDVIVEAFDEAWIKQNGKLPNLSAFEKIFIAVQLLDIYRDIMKVGSTEDMEISINYEIKRSGNEK